MKLAKALFSLYFMGSSFSVVEASETKITTEESCRLFVSNPDGTSTSVDSPIISNLSELTGSPIKFRLPPDSPKGVTSIECFRSSLVPVENDYKILMTGLKLIINIDDPYQLGMFELNKGMPSFWMIRGEMTKVQQNSINSYIKANEYHFKNET